MARLPGLTRHDDKPSVDGRNDGRVQVRDRIGDVALRPQARPVDTYSRPQMPNSGPNDFMQLAHALAQVSPNLQNYIDTSAERMKKEAEDQANRRIGGMSFEDARRAVDSGSMTEMQNPWFRAAFMRQYGERLAYQRVNELTREYETTFDRTQGNFDAHVRERARGDLEQHGSDPHFSRAYGAVMDQYGRRANQAQAQHQTEQTRSQTIGGVYDIFHGQARTMLQEGKKPEEIVAALRGRYEGNRRLLQVDFRDQDREMVRLAEAFAAEGNQDMVRAILQTERRGADGTSLGTLAASREFQADSLRIINHATRKYEENNQRGALDSHMRFDAAARSGTLNQDELLAYHRANPGAMTDSQVRSLVNQNTSFLQRQAETAAGNEQRLQLAANARASEADLLTRNLELAERGMLPYITEAQVIGESGSPEVRSVDAQKKAVAAEVVRRAQRSVETGLRTPEQAFADQVEIFGVGNLVNPTWQNLLAAGPVASNPVTNSGGQVPQQLRESTDLYMRLHAANPQLLDRHISDTTTRDFYESYRIATQYFRVAPEQALQTATMMTSDPSKFQSPAVQQRFQDIDRQTRNITFGGFLGFGTTSPHNRGYVGSEVSRLAKFFTQNGLPVDKALEEARKRFEATHTVVNGNYINTSGRDIPPNFGELATAAIERYARDFGRAEGGREARDLTIRPALNGNGWLIVDAVTQLPVENRARADVTLRSLMELDQERRLAAQQGVVERQARSQQSALERDLSAAERWLSMPQAYTTIETMYGRAEADKKKAEFEALLRRHNRLQ